MQGVICCCKLTLRSSTDTAALCLHSLDQAYQRNAQIICATHSAHQQPRFMTCNSEIWYTQEAATKSRSTAALLESELHLPKLNHALHIHTRFSLSGCLYDWQLKEAQQRHHAYYSDVTLSSDDTDHGGMNSCHYTCVHSQRHGSQLRGISPGAASCGVYLLR